MTKQMGEVVEAIRNLTDAIHALQRGGYSVSAHKLTLERDALERLVNN